MALFMDIHKGVDGLTAEAVAEAHKKDLEKQGEYGVKYLKVHKEAHGLMPDNIIEVKEGS